MSRLHAVTPVILTLNEEANLERLLQDLTWAATVIVVDSGSTDRTAEIAGRFANVRWLSRAFDTHAAQWRFGAAAVSTEYVLALDADYRVSAAFVAELERQFLAGTNAAGVVRFRYCVDGRPLKGSVYPPKIVLFRPAEARITQAGHTQEIAVDDQPYRFAARLDHDDHKPLTRFVQSQLAYARLEAERLRRPGAARWQDHLRRTALMPFVVGPGAYLAAGGPLAGRAALQYACERTVFEALLALEVVRRRFTTH